MQFQAPNRRPRSPRHLPRGAVAHCPGISGQTSTTVSLALGNPHAKASNARPLCVPTDDKGTPRGARPRSGTTGSGRHKPGRSGGSGPPATAGKGHRPGGSGNENGKAGGSKGKDKNEVGGKSQGKGHGKIKGKGHGKIKGKGHGKGKSKGHGKGKSKGDGKAGDTKKVHNKG